MKSQALDMEEPLREARNLVHALFLMNTGLAFAGHREEGGAGSHVAWAALERIDAVKKRWDRLLETGRG